MTDNEKPAYRWHRADETDLFVHCPDFESKEIYYAREYTSRAGYGFSETNQLITNFKIKPDQVHRLSYKEEALRKFAAEATEFLNRFLREDAKGVLVPVPPSTAQGDAGYDDRVVRVSVGVAERCTKVRVEALFERTASRDPKHFSDKDRSAEEELKTLGLAARARRFDPSPRDRLIVFDDVTTGGGTFEAARRLLVGRYPAARVIGVMWAKAKPMTQGQGF